MIIGICGLIGAGNIGSIVANRAHGLKMKVIAYDPFLTEERALELGIVKVDLDTLLSRADFVSLHTPLTDQTRNILSRERLENAKQGIRIVNCARGGLIDENALRDLLESGHVAGAALDVFETEPARESPPEPLRTPMESAISCVLRREWACRLSSGCSPGIYALIDVLGMLPAVFF